MSKPKLTFQQLEWLKLNYFSGDWEAIAKKFNKEFGEKKSGDAVRILYGRYRERDLTPTEGTFTHFTREALDHNLELGDGKYFVTGVMPLNKIDDKVVGRVVRPALETLLSEQKTIKPVLLPMTAHTKLGQKQPSYYDPALTPYADFFGSEVMFNKHLLAIDMKVNPQTTNPLARLGKQAQKQSIIIASPRQHHGMVATGNETIASSMYSTGVINYPAYQSNHTGRLAEEAHRIGGLIVEVKGDKFFARRARFDEQGGYYDLATYHSYLGNRPSRVEALVFGDIHFGHHDEELMKVAIDLIKLLKPKKILFHDAFDGLAISHHLNMIDKILRPAWAYSLETEAQVTIYWMNKLKAIAPADCEFIFVGSNHNNFLTRYLKDRRYMNDEINFKLAHQLQLDLLEGHNPLARLLNLNYIRFLGEDEDLFIKGIQCGNHGHIGVNGARGSRATVRMTASRVLSGHGHSPYEDDNHMGLGMWTKPKHGYNHGASTWMPTVAAIQPDASWQNIMAIRSKQTGPYLWSA